MSRISQTPFAIEIEQRVSSRIKNEVVLVSTFITTEAPEIHDQFGGLAEFNPDRSQFVSQQLENESASGFPGGSI